MTPTPACSAYRYLRQVERQRRDYRTSAPTVPGNNLTVTSGRSTLANQTGRPIAPARKLVAAVMGTIAIFVMALGLGMSSWGVVIFGLVLLALSIALGMVNMVRRGARAWVTGSAEVRAISPPPTSAATFGRAQLQVVVVAPGLPTSEISIIEPKVPVAKWPAPGDTLPIEVDVDDMRRVRIKWSDASPRERGEDPPPPRTYEEEPVEETVTAEQLLGEFDPPPWTTRDKEWGRGPDEPDDTVVVHETPAGKVVEGEVVNQQAAPLPRRATPAATATAERPAGAKPSPHPRAGTATATAEPETAAYTDSFSPAEAPAEAPGETPAEAPAETRTETPKQRESQDDDDDTPPWADEPQRRPEPTPVATASTPTPTSAPPTAPDPVTPPPMAPVADPIDIPLDHESQAADDTQPLPDDARSNAASGGTQFVSNGAHEDEVPTEPIPPVSPAAGKPLHSSSTVAAAVGAMASGMVSAVKKRMTKHDHTPEPDDGTSEVITAYPSARPGPAGSIHGVGLSVQVSNLARSIAFYQQTLGFHKIDSGEGSAVLASGDTRLVLRAAGGPTANTAAPINLNLEVGDVEAMYEDLRAKGVDFVSLPQAVNRGARLEQWEATFLDPDAHHVNITQWRAVRD
jgi:catechol 2,3-dioxygenase-like lactoylglutathione lyase family enzyme